MKYSPLTNYKWKYKWKHKTNSFRQVRNTYVRSLFWGDIDRQGSRAYNNEEQKAPENNFCRHAYEGMVFLSSSIWPWFMMNIC